MVAALQRVAAEPEQLQPPAARYQYSLTLPGHVVESLEVVAPPPVLVDFVEHPKAGIPAIHRRRMRSRSASASQFR